MVDQDISKCCPCLSSKGDFPLGCSPRLAHSAAPAEPSIRVKCGVWTKFPIIPLYGAARPRIKPLSHDIRPIYPPPSTIHPDLKYVKWPL